MTLLKDSKTGYVHLNTLEKALIEAREAKLNYMRAKTEFAKLNQAFEILRKKASAETLCKLMDKVGFI